MDRDVWYIFSYQPINERRKQVERFIKSLELQNRAFFQVQLIQLIQFKVFGFHFKLKECMAIEISLNMDHTTPV